MNSKYFVKCKACLKFYQDINKDDCYKNSIISFAHYYDSKSKPAKVIRCCPYCDNISEELVAVRNTGL